MESRIGRALMSAMLNTQKAEPFSGLWAFVDLLKSVRCTEDGAMLWCVRPRDATSPTKQEFPAAGEHSITLAVRHEGLRRPLVVGVFQGSVPGKCGNHHLGEASLEDSVGLVFSETAARYMAGGEYLGERSATLGPDSVVTLTVRRGSLYATVDGTALPPVEGRLQGNYRFAVSLCGEGQIVEIVAPRRSPGHPAGGGQAFVDRPVRLRPAADVQKALRGTGLDPASLVGRAGQKGTLRRYDADGTYAVAFEGGAEVRATRRCFDVDHDGGYTRWHVGDRVVRGPTWQWDNQDSGAGNVGVVVEVDFRDTPGVKVMWPQGHTANYRQTDLQPPNPPAAAAESSRADVGAERNPAAGSAQSTAASSPAPSTLAFKPTTQLLDLLERLSIQPYAQLLADEGYNSLAALTFATQEHLQSIGVLLPHALLLLKYRPRGGDLDVAEEAPAEGPATPAEAPNPADNGEPGPSNRVPCGGSRT